MLLALALYASTAHAGIPAGFAGTPGVVNENTPHHDLELLSHDGKAHRPHKRLLLRLPPSPRRGAHSPGTSASANPKTGVGAPLGVKARMARGENLPSAPGRSCAAAGPGSRVRTRAVRTGAGRGETPARHPNPSRAAGLRDRGGFRWGRARRRGRARAGPVGEMLEQMQWFAETVVPHA